MIRLHHVRLFSSSSVARFVRPMLLGLVAIAALTAAACTSSGQQYCEVAGECDDGFIGLDPVGSSEDSVAVCASDQQTTLDVLNANSEAECQEIAELLTAYHECVVLEGCDAFDILEPECKDEQRDFSSAYGDSQNRCFE
ncbi:MAG: hypothetical protein GY822_24415 [Deltaproteobacteria bacterium]|nr:hypothetical protein [Deltaproteobacteria bacterium]